MFSIHSIYVFYSWHCTDYFFIYQREFPLDPATKICLRFQAARCSQHLVGEHFVRRLRSSGKICQVKYPAMTLFQILSVMLNYILLNKLLICCRVFISFIILSIYVISTYFICLKILFIVGLFKLLLSIFDHAPWKFRYISFN